MTSYLQVIRCMDCQKSLKTTDILTEYCPHCDSPWLDAIYNYEAVAKRWQKGLTRHESTLWRYQDLLPVDLTHPALSMSEGQTPLYRLYQYEKKYQYQGQLYIKDERAQPTNSFKDRQAVLSVMAMANAGIEACVLASTGNAAVAYAAYCARAGIKLWLFLTSLVPAEKVREAALYGCEVIRVQGTYDETKQVAAEFARRKGLRFEKGAKSIPGKDSMKTLAFEIAEQLARSMPDTASDSWQAPGWYIQAVSGGIGPVGVWKGFQELYQMGLINKMPKIAVVQAAGCAPMVRAFECNAVRATPVEPSTLIHVLATGAPGKAYEILREACLSNGGIMLAVEDGETFQAMREAASLAGLSVEPAAAVAFAGLTRMLQDGIMAADETVILNCSGHTFPAESHILSNQYDQYVFDLQFDTARDSTGDGLASAIQRLNEQVTTVLVVDDNPLDRRLIRRLLQSYKQYRIYEARDARDALQAIDDRQPDLVILDLMMPEMNGFDLLDILVQNPKTRNIPIVVATAKTLTAADRQQLDRSVAAIWQKATFEPRHLVKTIVEILGHTTVGVIHPVSQAKKTRINPKIVIIDENAGDRLWARNILYTSQRNYEIKEAATGREGLKLIYEEAPELIILDAHLPDMNGIQIIGILQRDARLQDIPVVLYATNDLSQADEQALHSSIRNIIRKSDVSQQQFLTIVEAELLL